MSPRRIPYHINITHAMVEGYEAEQRQREREVERAAKEAEERANAERKERQAWATLEQVPAKYRQGGVVGYDRHAEGTRPVRESFSCACGKHAHGHGADHNPFANIIEPTELEFVEYQDTADEAQKLLARVNRARPKTPPVGGGGYPSGGRTNHTGRPMRR